MYTIRPVWRHFFWWLLLAPLVLVEVRALETALAVRDLDEPGRAQVVAARAVELRQTGYGFTARYQFQPPDAGEPYSANDLLGRTELFVAVDQAAFEQARATGTIAVAYLPERPWVNRPVAAASNALIESVGFWALFVLVDLAWVVDTLLLVRNFLRAQTAAERREPLRLRFWRVVPV